MTKKPKPTSTLPAFYSKSKKHKPEREDPATERHPSINNLDWYFMNAALQKSEFKNYSATKDSLMDLPSNASIVECQNKANPLYNFSLGSSNSHSMKIQVAKKVSLCATKPYKILDAPNLISNPSFNIFDWNNEDCLLVGLGNKAYTWNLATEEANEVYTTPQSTNGDAINYLTACSWVRGSSYFGVGLNTGIVDIINYEKQKKIRSFTNNLSPICKLHYYSPGKSVVIGNEDGNVSFHDLREKQSLKFSYNTHKGAVSHIVSEPSNFLIATGGNDNKIVLTDLRRVDYNEKDIIDTEGCVSVLKFSKLSYRTLFYCDTKNIGRKILLNNKIKKMPISEPVVDLLFYDPKDNDYYTELITVCKDKFVSREYNSMKKIKVIEIENETKIIKSAQNKKQGNVMVSASDDEKLRFWNLFGNDIKINENKNKDINVYMRNIRI
eukprot:GAHX01002018.1.p1 GENE.GAHX01002018.1~~GAHX01002018.1.p1  ORF type:complete len:439 (+),score=90.21 GAHX01002018.1:57-1373(+)